MYGAILGDIIGSPYEFDQGDKTKDFPLFSKRSELTDDTVMTVAVADAFLDAQPNADIEWIRNRLVRECDSFLLLKNGVSKVAIKQGKSAGKGNVNICHSIDRVIVVKGTFACSNHL